MLLKLCYVSVLMLLWWEIPVDSSQNSDQPYGWWPSRVPACSKSLYLRRDQGLKGQSDCKTCFTHDKSRNIFLQALISCSCTVIVTGEHLSLLGWDYTWPEWATSFILLSDGFAKSNNIMGPWALCRDLHVFCNLHVDPQRAIPNYSGSCYFPVVQI